MKSMLWTLAFLLETAPSQFEFKVYNPNEIIRYIVSIMAGLMIVVGVAYGGFTLWQGYQKQDPKEKSDGWTTIIASFAIGGMVIAVVNMVLA